MSHQTFAAIWVHLEARTDIDNVLREIIGQNSLESSVSLNPDELLNSSVRLIIFVKVIFDLQRTYSQSSVPSTKSPHLLQPRQLFLAIIYLLRLKSKVFCRSKDTSTEYVSQRSFLAQTLVSGLRALWLRRHAFPVNDIELLSRTLDDAWKGDKLNDLEKFLVKLQHNISKRLSDPSSSEMSRPACGQVQIRVDSTRLVSASTSIEIGTLLITVVSFGKSP